MSQQFHLLFWLNKSKQNKEGLCPLVMRLTYANQRKQVASGFYLSESDWQKVNASSQTKMQRLQPVVEFMQTFRSKALKIVNLLELEDRMDLDAFLALYYNKPLRSITLLKLIEQHNEDLMKRIGVDRAHGTVKKYKCLLTKVKTFLALAPYKKDIPLSQLDRLFMIRFSEYLLIDQKIGHNTVAKYCRNLKRILNYAKEREIVKANPFDHFKMGYKEVDRSFLTAGELRLLEEKTFTINRLEVVRDLFLFQCYTGLSFTDMEQLTKEAIVEGIDKNPWLVFKRQKTKVISRIPLLPPAINILNKYQSSCLPKGQVLPILSNQKFNAYLKEIAILCGINKDISSHAGRRTFATTIALGNGISMESIAKMLGHKSTKMTAIYAIVTDLKVSEEMQRLSKSIDLSKQRP